MAEMKRPIRIEGDVAYVPLTQGFEAVIDAADVHLVEGVNWRAMIKRRPDGSIAHVYAGRSLRDGKRRPDVMMHRVIAGTPDDLSTDHRDGDGLNNRRSNLRHATLEENGRNLSRRVDNTSGVKGVTWMKSRGKWLAQIRVGRRLQYLGYFADKEAAAAAYAAASAKLHGDFGRVA